MKKQSPSAIALKKAMEASGAIEHEDYLNQDYGMPGTEERILADEKRELIRLMLNLRELRKKKKIKLKTISSRMNVDDSTVSKLENFPKDIQISSLINYVKAMKGNITISVQIGDEHREAHLV